MQFIAALCTLRLTIVKWNDRNISLAHVMKANELNWSLWHKNKLNPTKKKSKKMNDPRGRETQRICPYRISRRLESPCAGHKLPSDPIYISTNQHNYFGFHRFECVSRVYVCMNINIIFEPLIFHIHNPECMHFIWHHCLSLGLFNRRNQNNKNIYRCVDDASNASHSHKWSCWTVVVYIDYGCYG